MPLLARLPPESRAALASAARVLTFSAGQRVVARGEVCEAFYVVREGEAVVTTTTAEEEEGSEARKKAAAAATTKSSSRTTKKHENPEKKEVETRVDHLFRGDFFGDEGLLAKDGRCPVSVYAFSNEHGAEEGGQEEEEEGANSFSSPPALVVFAVDVMFFCLLFLLSFFFFAPGEEE